MQRWRAFCAPHLYDADGSLPAPVLARSLAAVREAVRLAGGLPYHHSHQIVSEEEMCFPTLACARMVLVLYSDWMSGLLTFGSLVGFALKQSFRYLPTDDLNDRAPFAPNCRDRSSFWIVYSTIPDCSIPDEVVPISRAAQRELQIVTYSKVSYLGTLYFCLYVPKEVKYIRLGWVYHAVFPGANCRAGATQRFRGFCFFGLCTITSAFDWARPR
ncbi:hypothetical protein F5X97DRAFT_97427 [Nemania serpens]|nr:hypothetical protein F5X97DRAFT_97427 [Nemania serpens]